MNFISKILAPTDCSEASIDALKYSIKIAKTHRAELMVLYVISCLWKKLMVFMFYGYYRNMGISYNFFCDTAH